jgi:hypothetical protein
MRHLCGEGTMHIYMTSSTPSCFSRPLMMASVFQRRSRAACSAVSMKRALYGVRKEMVMGTPAANPCHHLGAPLVADVRKRRPDQI